MSTASTVTSGGIGLGGASFLVLLVLKVMDYIDMNWFWVLTSMLWVPVLTFCAAMSLMVAVFMLFALVAYAWGKLFGGGG